LLRLSLKKQDGGESAVLIRTLFDELT
jgi:hypothetical protein